MAGLERIAHARGKAVGGGYRPLASPVVVLTFAVACILVPLSLAPILPTIDLYNHVARYYVLAHLGEDPVLDAQYAANWRLLPNIGMDVVGTALLSITPPLLGAKLLCAFVVLLQTGGVVALRAALGRRSLVPAIILSATIAFSFIFIWGFLNFLFALAVALWIIAAWVRFRDRLPLATIIALAGGVLVMVIHGFAFALYGVMIAAIEFGCWLVARERVSRLVARLLALAGSAVPAALIFITSETAGRDGAGQVFDAIQKYDAQDGLAHRILAEAAYRAHTVISVAETGSFAWDIALFVAGALIVGFALASRRLVSDARLWPAIIALGVLCCVTPPSLFSVGFVSDRVPLCVALLACASIDAGVRGGWHRSVALLAALLLVRTIVVSASWLSYDTDRTRFEAAIARVAPGTLVWPEVTVGQRARDRRFTRRCEMWGPLVVPYARAVSTLFAVADAQPLVQRGRLERATAAIRANGESPDGLRGGDTYDVVLACNGADPDKPASFAIRPVG